MQAKNNVFLKVKPGVVLTPVIEPVICEMESDFKKANLYAFVTSGLRDAYSQLAIVKKYLKVKGLDKLYPETMACTNPTDMYGGHYVWQLAWSHLLNVGVIINPPLAAVCLMDYYGPNGKGSNRKGKVIGQTPHAKGISFDIGGAGGEDSTIKDELVVVKAAFKRKLKGMISFLPEHNNNAIHIDCKKV
jgi:hypothetical protein